MRSIFVVLLRDTTCYTAKNNCDLISLIPSSRLVLDTLTPLPTSRKCFRMINGVLVERTVGDVLPQLQSNADNMNKVLVELAKQYKTKQDDMEKWKVRPEVFSLLLACAWRRDRRIMLIMFSLAEKEQDPGCAAIGTGIR